tara:strand:+ start:97 stop:282 length:186 start_codon:yes stop_codon:yes gene_type:complete
MADFGSQEVVTQFMVKEALDEVPTAKGGGVEQNERLALTEHDTSLHMLEVGVKVAVVKGGR